MASTIEKDSIVTARTSQSVELRGGLLRLTRHMVTFELYSPTVILQVSQVLSDFSIALNQKTVYVGRAVIRNLIATNLVLVCEVTLDDQWLDAELLSTGISTEDLPKGFERFLRDWQGVYKIEPDFKVAIADLQTFLTDMRLWLEQVEMSIRSSPPNEQAALEKQIALKLGGLTSPALENLFDRLELLSRRIEADLLPAHRVFARRQLHPLLMCSPFLHRTFYKPLGYAGDYEMVNMVIRDPYEGSSLYAKLVNLWFLQQAPAEAHRNRIEYLILQLKNVTAKAAGEGRVARILNLGCGPAGEVQRFIAENHYADHAEFTLLDFNDETIADTLALLNGVKRRHHRRTGIDIQKRSVNQLLKESAKTVDRPRSTQYDFVYCAGLYDYLTDQVSRRVSSVLYEWTAPGGLFVVTNVDNSNPRTLIMDFVMDWHLIYRNARQMMAVRPVGVAEADAFVKSDITGVNLFLEIRKPDRE